MTEAKEMTQVGAQAVFRTLPIATTPKVLFQLERRERVVVLLLDGRRTLQDVSGLIHRSEVEVARTVVRLLQNRYIEYLGTKDILSSKEREKILQELTNFHLISALQEICG